MSDNLPKKTLVCQHCGKSFVRRVWYDNHRCEKKKRFEESHNINVITAHRLFVYWYRKSGFIKRKGKDKTMEEFCRSPYYKSFVKLVDFSTTQKLFSAFRYIDWIIENKLKEYQWYQDTNLDKFFRYVRNTENPMDQAQMTTDFILVYSEAKNFPPREFFRRITPGQALQMVKNNQLSPWVILATEVSHGELLDRIQGEIYFYMDEYLNFNYWADKIENDPDSVTLVNRIVEDALNE